MKGVTMKRKLLFGIIVVLLITNVATLLLWNKDEKIVLHKDETEISRNEPVATIGDKGVSYDKWMQTLREKHGKKQLANIIDREVVSQLAAEENIEISDKVIAREIALLTTMKGVMTKKETVAKEKEWRKDIKHRYQLGALLAAGSTIPEKKIRAFYEEYHEQYNFQASIQLSHIVVSDMKTAKKVKEELDHGASFGLLAQEYSTDKDTKNNGGYLGFFVKSSQFIPTNYADTATKMEERSYSDPIKSGNNVAIIYLHRKLPSITFTYEEIKPYIKRELALNKKSQPLEARPLWDKLGVEWVYK